MKRTFGLGLTLCVALLLIAVAPSVLVAQRAQAEQMPQFVASFHAPADALALTGFQGANRKEPLVAGLLSWLFPGLGNFYAGNGGHGWRHVLIEVGGFGLLVAGVAAAEDEVLATGELDQGSEGLLVAGFAVLVVNGVWSIFSSIKDAENYNRRAAGGGDGASLDLRPVFRVLPGAGTSFAASAPRAGLEVARLTF